jgi:hypothetical protein
MAEETKSKIGYLLERLAMGVAAHDRENPDHTSWGVGMAHFDIERLGLEEGDEILPGIVLQADGGVSGAFRVLCNGDHNAELEEEEEDVLEAISAEADERELEVVAPRRREREDEEQAPRIRPPF